MIARPHAPLAPLLLVSAAAVGFEIALTRYFAIASWSEYGYWVISITMAGFAVSGVVLSLFKNAFARRAEALMFAAPLALLVAATAGFWLVTINPFNPLELQNPDAWLEQLANIWKYYAALFPFYLATGLYIGLYFITYQEDIPKVYAADLVGAGAGALAVLVLMFVVHPFHLLAALLPLLAAAALYHRPAALRRRGAAFFAGLLALLAVCEVVLLAFVRADYNEYKAIYPPLNVAGNRVVQEVRGPRGHVVVLDNFTERLDTDLSNNARALGAGAPPRTRGLYRDGHRLTSLPAPGEHDGSYVRAVLDAYPYALRPGAATLLIGTRGGFRVQEALALGAASITALEPDETLFRLLRELPGGSVAAALADRRVRLLNESPAALAAGGARTYDVIDVASDFLDQADANKFAFTLEAVQGYYRALAPDGVISIPVSIREFTVYALKMIDTARAALAGLGVERPQDHIVVYRSSWNVRILVGRKPFAAEAVAGLRDFAGRRSFDTSYFSGIDPGRVEIWNDLPAVSFEARRAVSAADEPTDALMLDALKLLSPERDAFVRGHFFALAPPTLDRPFFYSVLHLSRLPEILARIALIPREELGLLINVAVLVQASAIALLILGLPLLRWRATRPAAGAVLKAVLYFAGLGLGFLFIEIFLIEKASFFLNDRTTAFAVVLAGMLVYSGVGSYLATNYLAQPRKGLTIACAVILAWLLLAWLVLDPALAALLGLPALVKVPMLLALIAPVSIALGLPFPLGLYLFRGERAHFLPWAWSLNGSFSVIATPLANLCAVVAGFKSLVLLALLLYALVYATYPAARGANRI